MKKSIVIYIFFVVSLSVFPQGQNNNYPIDNQDLVNILHEQGVDILKFPFKLKKGEFIDISVDVYEHGKLISHQNNIEQILKVFGVSSINHHLLPNDSTVFHRMYFIRKAGTLVIKFVNPGISIPFSMDISRVQELGINARTDVPLELAEKSELAFCYGSYSDKYLDCTTGVSLEKLKEAYDLVIMIYGERKQIKR